MKNRTIYCHELRPGDLIKDYFGDILLILSCVPSDSHPTSLRHLTIHSKQMCRTFQYDDITVDRSRRDKFPFVQGYFLARLKEK